MVPQAVVTELTAVSLRAQPGGGAGRHEQPPRAGLHGPPLLPPPELLGEPCQFVPVHFPAGSGHGELRVSWAGSAAWLPAASSGLGKSTLCCCSGRHR